MMSLAAMLPLLAGLSAAYPQLLNSRQSMTGVATFNNYQAQGQTVCGSLAGTAGTYGAAAGDISPQISGGLCSASIDMSQCAGQSPVSGYTPPSCPKGNCGVCYRVTNQGGIGGGSVGGIGNQIIVQIIDACPSVNAENFCKTDVPANQRCSDPGTNALDIDESAYQALTGTPFGGGANLNIAIEPAACNGGTSTGNGVGTPASSSSAVTPPTQTPATYPNITNPSSGSANDATGGQGGTGTTQPGSSSPNECPN